MQKQGGRAAMESESLASPPPGVPQRTQIDNGMLDAGSRGAYDPR